MVMQNQAVVDDDADLEADLEGAGLAGFGAGGTPAYAGVSRNLDSSRGISANLIRGTAHSALRWSVRQWGRVPVTARSLPPRRGGEGSRRSTRV